MLRVHTLAFLLVLASQLVFSQQIVYEEDFKPGYVKLKGGEQRSGLIGLKIPGTPESIPFKSADGTLTKYHANEIEGFQIDGSDYLTSWLNPVLGGDNWSFVELIVNGEFTLLRNNGNYFIIQPSLNKIEHLGPHYRTALKNMTRNCPTVSVRSHSVKLQTESLRTFVNAFNECVATKNPNLDGTPRAVAIGIVAGYDYSAPVFAEGPNETAFLYATKPNDKSLFQFGADVTFRDHKRSHGLGIYTGALYNSNRYSGVVNITGAANEVDEYSIDISDLKIPVGVEWMRMPVNRISIHARAGFIFTNTLKLTSSRTRDVEINNSIYTEDAPGISEFKRAPMLMGAVGVDYFLGRDHIRIQVIGSHGKLTATVNDTAKSSVNGVFKSFNVVIGYIF